jgi:hypothetical protein
MRSLCNSRRISPPILTLGYRAFVPLHECYSHDADADRGAVEEDLASSTCT